MSEMQVWLNDRAVGAIAQSREVYFSFAIADRLLTHADTTIAINANKRS
jgi:hypothetical protein